MPRKLIKRYLPHPDSVKENKFLSVFGKVIHDPQLWHLTRFSVSHAFMVGLFCAFIPVPFQMLLAAGGAVIFRANIAISVALVWITNPITMPFLFGFSYIVGMWALGLDITNTEFSLSWDWISDNAAPFLLGSVIAGTAAGAIGYSAIQLFWRMHVLHAWNARIKARQLKKSDK